MLDAAKLILELKRASEQLQVDQNNEWVYAQTIWNQVVKDQDQLRERLAQYNPLRVAQWSEPLETACQLKVELSDYTALAIDGSQIYPDRHQTVPYFLINIGSVFAQYNSFRPSSVRLTSTPYVLLIGQDEFANIGTTEAVNLLRQEFELRETIELAATFAVQSSPLCFFDGTIIFWFLESKEAAVRAEFLKRYIEQLDDLYSKGIIYIGYVSMPRSKELVRLLQFYVADAGASAQAACQEPFSSMVDVQIVRSFLKPFMRTAFFKSNSAICAEYPSHLQPYFCFVHVASEIVRIELPAWVAENRQHSERVLTACIDQALKGNGYPVILAEAHEQAVIKGADRELFYHMASRFSNEVYGKTGHSQKSIKKRAMSI